MQTTLCLAASLLLSVPAPQETQAPAKTGPKEIRWAEDGVHLLEDGVPLDALSGEFSHRDPVVVPTPEPSARTRAAQALEAALGAKVEPRLLRGDRPRSTLPRAPESATGLSFSADESTAALVLDGRLWVWRADAGAAPVGEGGLEGVRHFRISPDGSAVSYIDGFDLAIAHTNDGKRLRLTEDGGENQFHGELDWVYQEELYGRFDFQGAWWSPTGTHLAYMSIDESGVDTFTVLDYRSQQQVVETLKYPKVGAVNPRATLHVARAADGETVAADLSAYGPEVGLLITRVGWTPEGERCYAYVQDRAQTWADLLFVDPTTGATSRVFRDSLENAWVDRAPEPLWLKDGSFLVQSARTGFEHLYRYDRAGNLLAAVTHGDWRVREVVRIDEERGWIALTGSAPEYAIGDTAWRANLDGSSVVRLTSGRGHWDLDWNGDGSLAIARMQHMENPGEVWLLDAAGERLRQLDARPAPEPSTQRQWHQITTRDGEWIDVVVTLPKDLEEGRSYPIWLDTYGGPDSPSIRDQYRGPADGSWYIDLDVNVRTASGRGMKYTAACYRNFGAQELKDLEDAVAWCLATFPFADKERVAVSGWSYGGFLAAYALANSRVFSCAVAGAGVYDWTLYDTIYTERYMGLLSDNAEGYRRSSVIAAAKTLDRPLLIVHGAMDDNVHVQNAFQLVLALQEAGHGDFDLMVYPSSRHGVRSAHWPALRDRFLRRQLLGADAVRSAPQQN